jgi:hypothetical protein
MSEIITIGTRLIPKKHIVFIEAFDPATANPRFNSPKEFRGRLVLLNRDSVLTEATVEAFAEEHGFRLLEADKLAANPGVDFAVERFEPSEKIQTNKPYATRLRWRDPNSSEDQSKLLLTEPETVAEILFDLAKASPPQPPAPRRSRKRASAEPPLA